VESTYPLGPGDRLQIQIPTRSDLSGEAVINADGTILLPVLGHVRAADKTAEELSFSLRERYSILDPAISEVLVSVIEFVSRRVMVVGEVRKPGGYPFLEAPDLWQAILNAGGETPDADLSRVQIVRKDAGPGETKAVTVDLSAGVEDTPASTLPLLRAGDTVVIPSVKASGPAGNEVQVLGQVRTPGRYRLQADMTVVQALAEAGGTLPGAKLGDVRVTRAAPKGVTVYDLDIDKYLEEGRPAADLALHDGDIIMVPERTFSETLLRFAPLITSVAAILLAVNL
jgi:polysaccharide export outer membrane protein